MYPYDSVTSASAGCAETKAISDAITSRTVYDRRAWRSKVLKLRNLIVLTIRNAGMSTRASTGIAPIGSWNPDGYAKIVDAGTVAAAGLGMPTKYRLSTEPAWMLNRASRIAAAVTYTKPAA